MFSKAFNFEGRIRRTDYFLSIISFFIFTSVIQEAILTNSYFEFLELTFIPAFWFIAAQGVKRCHDKGKPGWYQIIPFYIFVLLFSNGDIGDNEYGYDPKEKVKNVL